MIQIYPLNCIQNTGNPIYILYPRYRYRLKYSFDTDLSIKLYPEYKKCKKNQIVSKIQIQIEIQFWYRFNHQVVSRIQEIQHVDCIQDTDTDWNTVLIQISYPPNCIQNTGNPINRLYPRYRYKLKHSFDTDLSIKLYPSIQIVSVKLYPSICSLGSILHVCI